MWLKLRSDDERIVVVNTKNITAISEIKNHEYHDGNSIITFAGSDSSYVEVMETINDICEKITEGIAMGHD